MEKRGIDVSEYQGTINWEKVKKSIDFAIIRCGYGSDIEKQDDSEFIRNANECTKLGIPFGVYLYSYAKNVNDATSEANHVLRLVKNYKMDYPIFYDVEDKSQNLLSNQELTKICETFCNILENNKYYVGIYANLYWFNTKLNSSELNVYDKWLAEWSNRPSYDKEYGMWQYSNDGKIDGINTRIDLNIAYKDYPAIMRKNNLNNINNDLTSEIKYTVVKGDSLWKIAKMYDVKWQDIAKSNNIKFPYIIKPNQILVIPNNNTNFNIGDKVVFKTDIHNIYTSVDSNKPIKAKYNGGIITAIFEGKRNELQLNTNRGYVRKEDVKKA